MSNKNSRTIRSETTKVFLVIFVILSILGSFAIYSTFNGAKTFENIKSVHLEKFIAIETLKQRALELISVSYVLSNGQDEDLLMKQLKTYDTLIASYETAFQNLKNQISNNKNEETQKLLELLDQTTLQFNSLISNCRQMTFSFLGKDKNEGAKFFKLLNDDIEKFKTSIESTEKIVSSQLTKEVNQAQSLLIFTSQFGFAITFLAILITILLIYYLMKFLSISLLPISNLMHNMRQAVFSIGSDNKVSSPVSKYSEVVFSGEIVGQDIFKVLFNEMNQADEINKIKSLFSSAFDQTEDSWKQISNQFPKLVFKNDKSLKLTFTPLYSKQNKIQSLMIVAEDVTEIEKLRQEAQISQKNMENILNNLQQGFLIIDSKGVVQPGFSQGAVNIFATDPTNKNLTELLRLEEKNAEEIKEWYSVLFDRTYEFSSVAPLGPSSFDKVDNKYIELNYRPIYKDKKTKEIERVICIAEDKTQERNFRLQAEKEKEYSKMIVDLSKDRHSFFDFISNLEVRLSDSKKHLLENQTIDIDYLFREMHTVKGEAATFHVFELRHEAHLIEQYLSNAKVEATLNLEQLKKEIIEMIEKLESILADTSKEVKSVIGDDLSTESNSRLLSKVEVLNFKYVLKNLMPNNSEVYDKFVNDFVLDNISFQFNKYKKMSESLATRLGKKVEFEIQHSEIKVLLDAYQSLISSSVHIFRNAIDHGIEEPSLREDLEKSQAGKISIQFSLETDKSNHSNKRLFITVKDDGSGVDTDIISAKALEKGVLSNEQLLKMTEHDIVQLVFSGGLSAKNSVSDVSGRGVGLSAVKYEANKMGGEVVMYSEKGKGSKITLDLPYITN